MLRYLLVLLLVSISARAPAADDPAVRRLNPELVPLYRQLMAGQHAGLAGKHLALNLRLKHATERFLLFADTQVVIDSNTSYYLIKWQYEPEDIVELIGKSHIDCNLRGTIDRVISTENPPRTPYLVVRLQSVSCGPAAARKASKMASKLVFSRVLTIRGYANRSAIIAAVGSAVVAFPRS